MLCFIIELRILEKYSGRVSECLLAKNLIMRLFAVKLCINFENNLNANVTLSFICFLVCFVMLQVHASNRFYENYVWEVLFQY